jgi:nicotinate-nucleotide adenylyltransferase
MAKIGLFGGTFDPPHIGHLMIAQEVLTQCKMDEIWFIPSAIPPHKTYKDITDNESRINMVKNAIRGNDRFFVSLIEFERNGPSYTIDTVIELKNRYIDHEFFFILGGDMINDLPNWYKIDQLSKKVIFIGVKRPGFVINSPFENRIIQIVAPQFEISSSQIRERFRMRQNTRYLLPDKVREYIEVNKIYG